MSEDETDSEEECLFIKKNPILFKKYKVIKKLCSGAFGSIYLGLCLSNNTYVAIKSEPRNIPSQHLENEAYFLYSLKGVGIPEILSYGRTKHYNILVEPFLGKSLFHLYQENNKHFDMKDICLMGIQIIDRLEWIHSKNVIHRDIKPDNFLIGQSNPNIIYLIDFGLSTKYRSSVSGRHIKFGFTGKLTGTTKYSSANSIRGAEQSRKDDLESVAYMIIFFMKGYLPWQDVDSKDEINKLFKIYMMKKNIPEKNLCSGLPQEIYTFLKYIKNLHFEEQPDYNYLRSLFKKILKKYNYIYNDNLTFSWVNKDMNSNKASLNLYKRKSNFHSRLFKQIQKNLELKEKNLYLNGNNNYKSYIKNKSNYIIINNNKNTLIGDTKLNSYKYKNNNNLYKSTQNSKKRIQTLRNIKNFGALSDYNYTISNINNNSIKSTEKININKNKNKIIKSKRNFSNFSNKNYNLIFNRENNKKINMNSINNNNLNESYKKNNKNKNLCNNLLYKKIKYNKESYKDEDIIQDNNNNFNNYKKAYRYTYNIINDKQINKLNQFNVCGVPKNVKKIKNNIIYNTVLNEKRANTIKKLELGDNNYNNKINSTPTNIKYITKKEKNNVNYYSIKPIQGQNHNYQNLKINNNNTNLTNVNNFNKDFYTHAFKNFNVKLNC